MGAAGWEGPYGAARLTRMLAAVRGFFTIYRSLLTVSLFSLLHFSACASSISMIGMSSLIG